MKKTIFILLVSLSTLVSYSQIMFSKNYTDTVGCGSWISSSLVANNNAYYINGGVLVLREECDSYWSRGLCFLKIDSVGSLKKTTYLTDCDKVIYEGNFSSFVINNSILFSCGYSYEYDEDTSSCFLLSMDTNLDTISYIDFIRDTTTKRALSLHITNDNNLIICGTTDSTYNEMLRLPDTTYTKACLFKLTYDGEIIWQKSYSFEDESDGCYSLFKKVIPTIDKGFIAIGYFDINHTIKNVIVKTDSLGNQEWVRVRGSSAFDNPTFTDVIETKDSCYVVCGAYAYDEEFGGLYQYDGWVFKLDINGNTLWDKKYRDYSVENTDWRDTIYNEFQSVVELNDGLLALVATSKNGTVYGRKPKLYILSTQGDTVHTKLYEKPDYWFNAHSIVTPGDNSFAIAGDGEFHEWNAETESWETTIRIFLIKTDSLGNDTIVESSINDQTKPITNFALNCYPNPASDETYVDIPSAIKEDILIVYSSNGQIVHEQPVEAGENKIDLCNLKPGMYLLRLKESGLYGKFVKE